MVWFVHYDRCCSDFGYQFYLVCRVLQGDSSWNEVCHAWKFEIWRLEALCLWNEAHFFPDQTQSQEIQLREINRCEENRWKNDVYGTRLHSQFEMVFSKIVPNDSSSHLTHKNIQMLKRIDNLDDYWRGNWQTGDK